MSADDYVQQYGLTADVWQRAIDNGHVVGVER